MDARDKTAKAYIGMMREIGLSPAVAGRAEFDARDAREKIIALQFIAGQAIVDLCRYFVDAGYDDRTRELAIKTLDDIATSARADADYSRKAAPTF